MISLDITNYNHPYEYLNGNKSMSVTPLFLARALVTMGRGSWGDTFNLGLFRIGELICKALAFSKIKNGKWVLEDRFFKLNSSEKTTISYYFGQALTKLYAEDSFELKWLLHLDDYAEYIEFYKKGTAVSKVKIGTCTKIPKSPDLIGIKNIHESHIFEAKGYSSGYDKSVMQHAINQVSQVKSYNGIVPKTKTACYFNFNSNQSKGIIIDPENDGLGIDLKLDEEKAINKYYSFFLKNSSQFSYIIELNNYRFLTIPVGVPNIYFGFDERILHLSSTELLENNLYENIEKITTNNNLYSDISLGYDGIILISKTAL